MKKLTITLQLELTVPDDWAVVDTSEGTPVLKLPDGRYLDIAVEPLFATDPEDTWSTTDDEDEADEFFGRVESEMVSYTLSDVASA